jgi:hypothetical protein
MPAAKPLLNAPTIDHSAFMIAFMAEAAVAFLLGDPSTSEAWKCLPVPWCCISTPPEGALKDYLVAPVARTSPIGFM